ncbi:MAG: hypothetical protein VKJ06_08865 [Vampirovibrionales bacterium]|nr:hypothetical protein [Vampirovibrionales bacterium]
MQVSPDFGHVFKKKPLPFADLRQLRKCSMGDLLAEAMRREVVLENSIKNSCFLYLSSDDCVYLRQPYRVISEKIERQERP